MTKGKESEGKKVCEKCGGALYIPTEDGAVPCDCLPAALMKQRLRAANIPPRFQQKTIESFKGNDKKRKQLRTDAKVYVQGFPPQESKKGLLFMGTTGCGKTHLAIGILKATIEKGYTGYYCNVIDFFTRLRDTFRGDTEYDEMDMLDKISKVDMLVLDDLGAEKSTDWVRDRIYAIVNARYEQNLPVLVTTNKMDLAELEDHVGKRIVSRLCEMCLIRDQFPDEDYRMKGLDLDPRVSEKSAN